MEEAFLYRKDRIAAKHLPVPKKNTGILKIFLTFFYSFNRLIIVTNCLFSTVLLKTGQRKDSP